VKSSWDVWQHGQGVQWKGKACRTYPLKRLLDKGFRHDIDRVNMFTLSRTRKVMKKIEDIAIAKHLIVEGEDISTMSREVSDNIFNKSFDFMIGELYSCGSPKRPGETILATLDFATNLKLLIFEKFASTHTKELYQFN
jgi:hypothetical protein